MAWRTGAVLRYLRTLGAEHGAENLSDLELVERYAAGREEAAFEALVRRHGPLVWRVCREVTGHEQDAEDAFQAAFLVLARRLGGLRKRSSLASWLYGIAYRVALRARAQAARRPAPRQGDGTMSPAEPLAQATRREEQGILHEELSSLAEKYRAPLLLCYLQGMTQDEAARQLAWSINTFRRRLDRGRSLLQARLVRRGLGPATVLGAAALAPAAQGAALPAGLTPLTIQAARAFATRSAAVAGASTKAAALAEAVLRATAVSELKTVAAVAIVCGVLMAGTGVLAYQLGVWRGSDTVPRSDPVAAPAARPPEVGPSKGDGLDAFGDPLPEGAEARLGTTRLSVGDVVFDFAFAPDGRTLAAAGDGFVLAWDPATAKVVRRVEVPGGRVYAFAFAPDGNSLAAGGQDGVIRLWEQKAGAPLREIGGHGERVSGLRFSPDGETLTSVGTDGTLRLWRVATGEECGRITVPGAEGQYALARPIGFFPDNRTVVTLDLRCQVRRWDASTGKELPRLDWLPDRLTAVALARDGSVLAAAVRDQTTVRLWQVASGQELHALHGHQGKVDALAFSPDGATLASSSVDGTIRLWDVATGSETGQAHTGEAGSRGLAFSPDGRLLASGSETRLRLWKTATGEELYPSETHRGGVLAVAFLPDQHLLSVGTRGTAIRWDAGTGRQVGSRRRAQAERQPTTALSADGQRMATGGPTGIIRVSDLETGQEMRRWQGHKGLISSLAFSPDGQTLASGGLDDTLALWEPLTGRAVNRFADGHGPILSAAFSPDGRFLARGDGEGTVALREAATGKVLHRLTSAPGGVWALTFSPDGKTLASATTGTLADRRQGTASLWEVATGRVRWQTPVPDGGVYTLTFAPDGRTLASGGGDHRVHRWDLASGRELPQLVGHLGQVTCLAYSPSGARLVSGSMDATGLIWKQTPLPPLATLNQAALAPGELEALWNDLAAADAERAYRAIWTLAASAEQAVPLLEARLRPAAARVGEHEQGKTPSDAAAEPPEWLRALRALEVLERAGTPQASRLLEALANGDAPGQLAEEARAALGRLERRRSAAP